MLTRVAENLYWIGRYIERAEYFTRFIKVQYFSTVDAPMIKNKDFALRSILYITGTEIDQNIAVTEEIIWDNVLFGANNPNSVCNNILYARENARSIKNTISQELWETINRLYHFSRAKNNDGFTSSDLFEYSREIATHIAVIKFNILNTLLHDDVYHFILLGKHIERGQQILRILRGKISDWEILSDNGVNKALIQYQWTILLKALEAFDVQNQFYKGKRSQANIFELILSNAAFPRSIKYTCSAIMHHLNSISIKPSDFENALSESRECINTLLEFNTFEDQDAVINYIEEMSDCIKNFHNQIHELYFQ